MDKNLNTCFIDILQTINNLVIYRNLKENPILKQFMNYIDSMLTHDDYTKTVSLRSDFISLLIDTAESSSYNGNIFQKFIIGLLLDDKNIFSLSLEKGVLETDSSLWEIVLKDMDCIIGLMNTDVELIFKDSKINKVVSNYFPINPNNIINKHANATIDYICDINDAQMLAKKLAWYYNSFGCGDIAKYKMFKYSNSKTLTPIENNDETILSDIIGYESQKNDLINNTEAFISGFPHNNALLVGARGTGKSSLVKALVNEYFEKGLRLLEISKDQLVDLPKILDSLKKRGKCFIIFLDDLSFDDFETQYKYLKSVLEGSAEVCPPNVVFYATSNRRHIIQQKWDDKDGTTIKDGEIHASDTVNEKLSLSDRFGITVVFEKPSPNEYLKIVKGIAEKEGITVPDEILKAEAMKWELNQKGLSGRSARQYINSLVTNKALSLDLKEPFF